MSRTHDIDNEDPFFHFDPYEQPRSTLEVSSREARLTPVASCAQLDATLIASSSESHGSVLQDSAPIDEAEGMMNSSDAKGKATSPELVSGPLPMFLGDPPTDNLDLFSMSFSSASSSSGVFEPFPSLHFVTSQVSHFETLEESSKDVKACIDKGKDRESPPTLPPLTFSPTEFIYEGSDWPPLAGPSSYQSSCTSANGAESAPSSASPTAGTSPSPLNSPEKAEPPLRPSPRSRSMSNRSAQSQRSTSASVNKSRAKIGSSKASGTFARKLLFKKRETPPSTPLTPTSDIGDTFAQQRVVDTDLPSSSHAGQGGCFFPWSKDCKPRTPLSTPVIGGEVAWGAFDSPPLYRRAAPAEPVRLRTKGRSYSSPLPISLSAFDIVPLAPADIYAPPPEPVPNYFDEYLPRELKLHVFSALVALHTDDHERRLRDGKWTAIKASSSRNKWVGRDRGVRELFKLSRVSKSWQELVFDGQLWMKLDLRSFAKLPLPVLSRLSRHAGGFIKTVDFTGYPGSASLLEDMISHLSIQPVHICESSHTQLTTINLQGCLALTSRSLQRLLMNSPLLQNLCLKGLSAVTNVTCDVIRNYCPQLTSLDLSRCPNMSGEGVRAAAATLVDRGEVMLLKELRLVGLKRVSDGMMAALGKAAPYLEVLDLSYARDLHNSDIEAFVASSEERSKEFPAVQLTSREAGRDPADCTRYWRRVTRLRHLALSSCTLLTDHACSHLAFAVPKLEFLELGGIGAELGDDGIIRLLNTTPFIRRLDLEDASDISDSVLAALTPSQANPSPSSRPAPPEPGHALEHLIISYANVSNDALMALVRACPRLRVLEADNTRLSGLVLKEFVQLARERKLADSKIVAIDCRGVGEYAVKDLTTHTRPRLGWRSWHARKLGYLDARDAEGLNVGQDECDEQLVVVKTFYSWQTVDAVKAAREKKRKSSGSRRATNGSGSSVADEVVTSTGRTRWWSPSSRRSSGPSTPTLLDMNGDRDGCTIM